MQAVFTKVDFTNASIVIPNSENTPLWHITTTCDRFRRRKVTTIAHADQGGPSGAINWKDKTFEIHGRVRAWDALKTRKGGFFSESRTWGWSERHRQYKLKFQDHEWRAYAYTNSSSSSDASSLLSSNSSVSSNVSGRMIPVRVSMWKKDKPAMLSLSQQVVDDQDDVLLVLAFLYSEIKRLDRNQNTPA